MMKKKITIGDIAKNLNISKTSVSFVITGKARQKNISVKLEKIVLDYIKQVGYIPNQYAQSLTTGKSKLIGVLVESISDPFFSSVARMIEDEAYKKGYRILYSSTENDTKKAKDLIALYRKRQVDGYIIVPPPGIEIELNDLINDGFAVVLFDRTLPGVEANNVVVDNYLSSYTAIEHLIKNGYRNIAMVTLMSNQIQMMERERGYIDALHKVGKSCYIKRVSHPDQKENIVHEIQEFLESHQELDAVFFATNYIADSGLESIMNMKSKRPTDFGVVVFDDHNLFRLFTPSVTAIAQPIEEISAQIINLMLDLLSNTEARSEVKNVVLPTTLVVRESSMQKNFVSNTPQLIE